MFADLPFAPTEVHQRSNKNTNEGQKIVYIVEDYGNNLVQAKGNNANGIEMKWLLG